MKLFTTTVWRWFFYDIEAGVFGYSRKKGGKPWKEHEISLITNVCDLDEGLTAKEIERNKKKKWRAGIFIETPDREYMLFAISEAKKEEFMGPLQRATMLEQDDQDFDQGEDDHVSEKTRLNNEKSKRLDSGVLLN